MRSLNRVMFIGRLATDVELRVTKQGKQVANFPIAISRFHLEDGEKKECVDYFKIVLWDGLAKISGEYLKKGQAVFIEGRLINRSFEDNEGHKHYRTEVVADNLNILSWSKDSKGQEGISVKDIAGKEILEVAEV